MQQSKRYNVVTDSAEGTMAITISRYTLQDIPEMVQCIKTFLSEERVAGNRNHFFGIDIDESKLYNLLTMNVRNIQFFTNIVKDQNGKIVGGLSGQVVPYIFSQETVAVDHLLYFDKDFVNVKALLELIKSYVAWAERRNVREVQLCTSTGFNLAGFTKLVTRCGFQQFEAGFSRRFR